MNLVNYYKDKKDNTECFLNMDFIEHVIKCPNERYIVWMISKEEHEISESAYNTILRYGKAEI